MKKQTMCLLSLFMAVALLFNLSACKGNRTADSPTDATDPEEVTDTVENKEAVSSDDASSSDPVTVPPTTVPTETQPPATEHVRYEYDYLVASDFRRIRSNYPEAVALHGYYITFDSTQLDGQRCSFVMTYVAYRIISDYHETTLHNMTTGETIIDPISYYNDAANRYYGGTHLYYMEMENFIRSLETSALEGITSMIQSGENSSVGIYVEPEYLNM